MTQNTDGQQAHRMPLAGIRVTDLTQWGAGPMAMRVLADYGAEVIRVESMVAPEGGRLMWPLAKGKTGYEVSAWTSNYNANKLSITLNLADPRGLDLVRSLIQVSDVVADAFPPDVMEKLGLHHEELRKVRPDIITLSLPMCGATGPYRHYRGFGNTIAAMAGLPSLMGFPGRPPIGTGTTYTDFTSGPVHAATALLAALHFRNRTGQGQHIEVAQVESAIAFLGISLLDYTANGRVPEPDGNSWPYASPHGVYRCAGDDRWCAIGVFTDEEWQGLCRTLGEPSLVASERFATFRSRQAHEGELSQIIEAWTSTRTPHEVMEELQGAGVPAAAVQDIEDLLAHDAQMKHRGHYVVMTHPEAGNMTYEAPIYKLPDAEAKLRSPQPLIGQHNDHVFKEILGISEEQINQLIVEGVIN